MIPLHLAQQLADALRAVQSDDKHRMHYNCMSDQCDGCDIDKALAAFDASKSQPVKVKLPAFQYKQAGPESHSPYYEGRDDGIDDCIAALKAQGIIT